MESVGIGLSLMVAEVSNVDSRPFISIGLNITLIMVTLLSYWLKMALLRTLKTDERARKIFGKRELKIVEKQLMGVNLTQSEKNRLSRDIRKKLGFMHDIAKFSNEFGLKKGFEIKKLMKESKEIILNDILAYKIKKIILYGSAIENKLTLLSDIDIAVEFISINLKEATLFIKRLSGRLNSRIDLQVCNVLQKKIKKEVSKKGKIIYHSAEDK